MSTPEKKVFAPYVDNALGLLSVLRMTSSVVVGSAVLRCLLSPNNWDVDDLDILMTYTSVGEFEKSAMIMRNFFFTEGYEKEPADAALCVRVHVCDTGMANIC